MDDKGILFTSDLLLAMIIVTIAMGIAIDQFDQLNFQLQDFTGRQSLDKTVNDAADYLVKSSGNPSNWENKTLGSSTLPGLAFLSGTESSNNFLDPNKVDTLQGNPSLISHLVHTNNYELLMTRADNSSILVDINSTNPNTLLSNAKEIAVANRTVVVLSSVNRLSFKDLMHINPSSTNTTNPIYIWYQDNNKNGNGTTIFVGPGKVTTAQDNSSSLQNIDLNTYDYYVYVDQNYATSGSPVNTVQYGFTEGDVPLLTYNYNDSDSSHPDDKARSQLLSQELNYVYSPGNWQKLSNTAPGSLSLINNDMKKALDYYNQTPIPGDLSKNDLKMWISVESNPNAYFSLSVVQVYKGNGPFQRIPAKLVLKIWV